MRVLLADHSSHAQRMGERILRDEGHVVIVVTDGETAMLRLKDAQPQLVLADIKLTGYSGYEICEWVKKQNAEVGVVLTAGTLDTVDEKAVERVRADGLLRKPFEASALIEIAARFDSRGSATGTIADRTDAADRTLRPTRSVVVLDPEQIRAAVTVALDEALQPAIDRITERVIAALSARR